MKIANVVHAGLVVLLLMAGSGAVHAVDQIIQTKAEAGKTDGGWVLELAQDLTAGKFLVSAPMDAAGAGQPASKKGDKVYLSRGAVFNLFVDKLAKGQVPIDFHLYIKKSPKEFVALQATVQANTSNPKLVSFKAVAKSKDGSEWRPADDQDWKALFDMDALKTGSLIVMAGDLTVLK